MAFEKSVVLHFPEEIYRTTGIAEIAPQLLRALDPDKVCAVQFLRNGRVRVTCKSTEYRDDLLEGSSFLFGDVPVTAADLSIRSVFVRDLPFEVPGRDVQSSFESFGVVHSVHQCFFRDFPSVANGTRRLVMSFRNPIPSSVSVGKYPVRVWYAGKPVVCTICHESGHRVCAVNSQGTWPGSVHSPGAHRPLFQHLYLYRVFLFPCPYRLLFHRLLLLYLMSPWKREGLPNPLNPCPVWEARGGF